MERTQRGWCANCKKKCLFEQGHKLERANGIHFAFLNWSVPGSIKTQLMNHQTQLFSSIVNRPDVPRSIGMVVMPVFAHMRGMLWKTENTVHELLANHELNLDRAGAIVYEARADERDNRPLLYPFRFAVPMDQGRSRKTMDIFKKSPLVVKQMTPPAQQIRSRDATVIEDLSDTSLPSSTDAATHVGEAEKHQQLGMDACKKILQHIVPYDLNNLSFRSYICVVDLSVRTADLALAYLELINSYEIPSLYVGLCEGETHK